MKQQFREEMDFGGEYVGLLKGTCICSCFMIAPPARGTLSLVNINSLTVSAGFVTLLRLVLLFQPTFALKLY